MFTILVVEDDKNTRKLMCAVLRQNGFEPLQAEDGVAALEVMDKQHIDLVVLDLMMPNLDGYELTKQLRLAWENLPILMVTARQEPKDKRKFFFLMIMLCILLGMAFAFFFSKKTLNPIRKVIAAIHKVARGDFNVRVELKGIGELEELSQSFNKMTNELSSIETLRSDFVNNFSHEFKTPIVSMRGFAKLLKEENLSEEERREYLDIIIAESERLAALSTNVLNMSKYENIKIIPDKAPFRLDEQIRRVILLMEPKWSRKGLSVNVDIDEVTFNGNEDFTQQIRINLLDNAIKFSYQGGLISICLVSINDGIRFTIQDDGAGMDEQTKVHIFDKFYQGDTSQAIAGNGLGLAIVKKITQVCGGTIEVKSELGKGSLFAVFLPNEPAAKL